MGMINLKYHTGGKERIVVNLFVLQMLFSLWPWFIYFYVSGGLKLALGPSITLLAFLVSPYSFHLTSRDVGVFLLLLIAALLGTSGNINAYLGTILRCVPFLLFMAAKQEIRVATLESFSKWYVWILGISLLFWTLFLIGIPLPHVHLKIVDDNFYEFDNYYFFIKNTHLLFSDSFFPRFNSIFLEPGYVACFIVLMLFGGNYDFRRLRNVIYLAALIMTFSLAGWFLFFIALIPFLNQKGHIKWVYIVMFIGFIGIFLYLNNKSEANVVNMLIGERLRMVNGEMAGYNRANDEIEALWRNGFLTSSDALWGLREEYYTKYDFGASVDSRAYIIRFGIIAFVFYVWFLFRSLRTKWSSRGLWIFVIVSLFVYRGYSIMFSDALLFVYISSLEVLLLSSTSERKKNIEPIEYP